MPDAGAQAVSGNQTLAQGDLVAEAVANPEPLNATMGATMDTAAEADNATGLFLGGDQPANATVKPPDFLDMDVSLTETALTTAAYLCLLLGIILLGYFLLRKFGPRHVARSRGAAQPRLLGRLMVGSKQSVSVVKVMGRILVLGVTERSVTLLDKLTPDGPADEEEDEHAFTQFAEMLGKTREKPDGE